MAPIANDRATHERYLHVHGSYGPNFQCMIWPEVRDLIDIVLSPALPTRSHVGRFAVAQFRERSEAHHGTDLVAPPSVEEIAPLYPQGLTAMRVKEMPVLNTRFAAYSQIHLWLDGLIERELASSYSNALRRVIAYEVPSIQAFERRTELKQLFDVDYISTHAPISREKNTLKKK